MSEFQPLPNKKYDIIYADPPWQYKKTPIQKEKKIEIEQMKHYDTVDEDILKQLPVCDIAKEDCILFVWVVSPKLKECMGVIDAWDCFKFITVGFVWEKQNPTFGNYTLPSCEMCLIYKKGKIPLGGVKKYERQFLHEKKTRHSTKPKEIRARIDRMFPGGDKIELFARQSQQSPLFEDVETGWDAWGEEA